MKKQWTILGLAALLLLVLLLLLLIPDWDPHPDTQAEEPAIPVFTAPVQPIRLEITNSVSNYTVHCDRSGEEPRYSLSTFGEEVPLYQGMLAAMFTAAGSLEAQVLVADAVEDPAPYGLQNPATVEIFFEDGTATTLLLGSETPEGGSLYLTARGDHLARGEALYAVRVTAVEPFLQGALELIHPTVTATGLGRTLFETATFSGLGVAQSFTVTAIPPATADALSEYRLTAPLSWPVSRQGLTALQTLFGLIANDIVAVNPEEEALQGYGLDFPQVSVTVTGAAEGDFTLHASAVGTDGMVYLLREGVPVVYRVAAGQLPWLEYAYHDFMDRTALTAGIAEVSSILVETPDDSYAFAFTGEGEALTVTLDGQPLELTRFRPYYQTLVSARLERYTDDRPAGDAAPLLTVTFTYRGGGADTLYFYAGIPMWRFISTGDLPPMFYISSAYVDRVIGDAARLRAGETVTAY